MTQTKNYALPQWSASDRVKRSDFNAAMSKIDTQMKANANNINTKAASSTVTSLQTTVNGKADKSTVTALQTAVNGKADSSAVQTALAGKADASDLSALQTTVAGKADASALDAKADASTVSALQTTVNGKADSSTVAALQTTVAGKADASAVAALATALGTGGQNARIAWGSYTGDGTCGADHAITLSFPFYPMLVMFGSWSMYGYVASISPVLRGVTTAKAPGGSSNRNMTVSWTDNSVSYYHAENPADQYNYMNTTYHYFAIGYDKQD